jgi:hypothetical protein
VSQIFDKSAHISASVRVRWAKTIIIRIAERVARNGSRMEHAQPRVVKANGPARHSQAACVPPADELPEDVSALKNDPGDLGLDREPLPSRWRRVEIDCAVLRKVDLSLRASRLEKVAGVIRGREADAV